MTLSPMQLLAISEALAGLTDEPDETPTGEIGSALESAYRLRLESTKEVEAPSAQRPARAGHPSQLSRGAE